MNPFRFEEQKNVSLRHRITDDIRNAIFRGNLKPGFKLREAELSKQMGVSRGPVREAMRTLEQEGLLCSLPYKETTVADITQEEVTKVLIPVRVTIEQFAVLKALPKLNEQHYSHLAQIIEQMRAGAGSGNLQQVVESDLAFHEYIVSLSDSSQTSGIWTSIYNRIRLFFLSQGAAYEDLQVLADSHTTLLQLLREGDTEKIAQDWQEHIHDVNLCIIAD